LKLGQLGRLSTEGSELVCRVGVNPVGHGAEKALQQRLTGACELL
jgi:hypothetical protein